MKSALLSQTMVASAGTDAGTAAAVYHQVQPYPAASPSHGHGRRRPRSNSISALAGNNNSSAVTHSTTVSSVTGPPASNSTSNSTTTSDSDSFPQHHQHHQEHHWTVATTSDASPVLVVPGATLQLQPPFESPPTGTATTAGGALRSSNRRRKPKSWSTSFQMESRTAATSGNRRTPAAALGTVRSPRSRNILKEGVEQRRDGSPSAALLSDSSSGHSSGTSSRHSSSLDLLVRAGDRQQHHSAVQARSKSEVSPPFPSQSPETPIPRVICASCKCSTPHQSAHQVPINHHHHNDPFSNTHIVHPVAQAPADPPPLPSSGNNNTAVYASGPYTSYIAPASVILCSHCSALFQRHRLQCDECSYVPRMAERRFRDCVRCFRGIICRH